MSHLYEELNHAKIYSQFRPYPPTQIIEIIVKYMHDKNKLIPPFHKAVDIGCGSGQSTIALSPYFNHIIGVDASEAQIKYAQESHSMPNIEYKVSDCDDLPVSSSTVQLVTFCQSIHWFNPPDNIYTELRRIIVPNGVVAAYGYCIPFPKTDDDKMNMEIHELVLDFCLKEKIGAYGDKEICTVQNKYANIDFPFIDKQRIEFANERESTLADYVGYLSSRSPYQKFLRENPNDAQQLLEKFEERIKGILESKNSSENILLKINTDYFMIIGHL